MSLEQKLRERKIVVAQQSPQDVLEQIRQGKKFIVVDNSFNQSNIPLGYMLIDMRYKNESFKTLVPQNLLFYLANPGEGNGDDALDEIGDFYNHVQDFEDELLEEHQDSVQGTNWAVAARKTYATYLINKLTKPNEEDPDHPEWNEDTLKSLDLEDDYVARRIKAIAAIALGKTAEQVKDYQLGDILKHVTVNERKTEPLSKEEFDKITCWAGSHYEIKEEYKTNSEVEFDIERRHDLQHRVGTKTTKQQNVAVLDARIDQLEKEIVQYRQGQGHSVGRHDQMLLRMYTNLRYIAKEDPYRSLEIKPNTGAKTDE